MKKTILICMAVTMALAAHSTVLRVSNVTETSAPYSSFDAAQNKAAAGDTIMMDGSAINYGNIQIVKRIVLIGPGYLLDENGINSVSHAPASVNDVEMRAEGIVMQGMSVEGKIDVLFPKCVINRCRVNGIISLWGPDESWDGHADNCVIHQNLLNGRIEGDFFNSVYEPTVSNALITNNIFTGEVNSYRGSICWLKESVIAYNTWPNKTPSMTLISIFNSTINNNIFPVADVDGADVDGREYANPTNLYNARNNNVFLFYNTKDLRSFEWDDLKSPFEGHTNTDLAIKEIEVEHFNGQVGAFAGTDPYVISGVPTGPFINDIEMPTSIEMGSKLNVTIKIDISR